MGLASAVLWWEEWQLRILVLGSLGIQWLLFFSASCRKFAIPSWFRSIIWLAYLGSDALAIYALANLFSRQSRQDCSSGQGNSILEVVWAPVLLMHLGGQDVITAYNIEDNDLWTRHIIVAVSQITVAIYVFCKTWPGGDKRLLQASILLFVPGILKCIEKPWALKSASFGSLVSPSNPAPRRAANRDGGINSLEDYVQAARACVLAKCHPQDRGEGDTVDLEHDHAPQAQGEANEVDLEGNHHHQDKGKFDAADLEPTHVPQTQGDAIAMDIEPNKATEVRAATLSKKEKRSKENKIRREKKRRSDLASRKLFVDLASSYPDRLSILETFLVQVVCISAYDSLQEGLFEMFDFIYTKNKMKVQDVEILESVLELESALRIGWQISTALNSKKRVIGTYIRNAVVVLSFAAIGLFHKSHREAYNINDVKVTYALFCCTAVLELFASPNYNRSKRDPVRELGLKLSHMVAQYSLLGFFVRNKRHTKKLSIASFFKCKDFLDQRWSMDSGFSSSSIVELVLGHVECWWKEHIVDAASYRKFNDHRGQWTIQHTGCDQDLEWSLNRPFDESVLLWHIATDLCFYQMDSSSVSYDNAKRCREISHYMVHLMFINPEMLLSGTRRDLFMEANAELEDLLKGDKTLLKKIVKGDKPSLMETLKCNKPFLAFLMGKGPSSKEIEKGFMQKIIAKLQVTECKEEDPGYTEPPMEAEQRPSTEEGFIQDAWKISKVLLALGDEKMWEVIEGVWVEMLCFSASRCRGYLHAKSMGSGVELLTYVWFLLSLMGMETLPERLQRTELPSREGNAGTPPSTSQIHEMENPTRFRHSRSREEAGGGTSSAQP